MKTRIYNGPLEAGSVVYKGKDYLFTRGEPAEYPDEANLPPEFETPAQPEPTETPS